MRAIRAARAEAVAYERSSAAWRPWPLPVRGWYGNAGQTELNPQFADTIENLWFDGARMTTRPGHTVVDQRPAYQRIPYEFGANPHLIEVNPTQVRANGVTQGRANIGRMMAAEISSNVVMVDGRGEAIRYDGTAFHLGGFTADGADPDGFQGVIAHHDRLYFWSADTLEFWYGDVGAVMGALTKFPLDRLGNIRGTIVAMGSFTIDAKQDMDDVLCILTSAGDLVVYAGLDPGDATDWRILGRAKVAVPVSRFGLYQHGSDLYVLTAEGLTSMRVMLNRGTSAPIQALTSPIRDEMKAAVAVADPEAIQVIAPPDSQYLLVSFPGTERAFVYGFAAQGWFNWTGMKMRAWHRFDKQLRATLANGREAVIEDGAGDGGVPISCVLRSTWLRGPSTVRQLRPMIKVTGPLTIAVDVEADHEEPPSDPRDLDGETYDPPYDHAAAQVIQEPVRIGTTGEVFRYLIAFSATSAEIVGVMWR